MLKHAISRVAFLASQILSRIAAYFDQKIDFGFPQVLIITCMLISNESTQISHLKFFGLMAL